MSKPKISCYTASNSSDQQERIEHDLLQLGLKGMYSSFVQLAEENIAKNGTPQDYLELLLEKQRHYKENARIQARIQQARFIKIQTLAEYRFHDQPSIKPRQIHDLASCIFVKGGKNIIFLGQSGVGKTHLANALGIEAIYHGHDVRFIELKTLIDDLLYKHKDVDSQRRFLVSLTRPALLIVDEMKQWETTPTIRDFLYRLFRQRYDEQKATIFTSNKDFAEWGKLFGDDAEAILDRILDRDRLTLIQIEGESQRVENKIKKSAN